jgi:hypothetical protein
MLAEGLVQGDASTQAKNLPRLREVIQWTAQASVLFKGLLQA